MLDSWYIEIREFLYTGLFYAWQNYLKEEILVELAATKTRQNFFPPNLNFSPILQNKFPPNLVFFLMGQN